MEELAASTAESAIDTSAEREMEQEKRRKQVEDLEMQLTQFNNEIETLQDTLQNERRESQKLRAKVLHNSIPTLLASVA